MVGMRVISSPHYSSTTILYQILTSMVSFVSVLSSLTFQAPSTRLLFRNLQSDFLWLCKKQDGGLLPILWLEIWRHCFTSLAVNATPVRHEAAKIFTSTYDDFIQTAGIREWCFTLRFFMMIFIPQILMTLSDLTPLILLHVTLSH